MDSTSPFSKKQTQIIQRALDQLAGKNAYKPITSVEDLKVVTFGRLLQLTNNRAAHVTDHGMAQVKQVVNTTVEAAPFADLVEYADVWSASWKTLEELISIGKMAESAQEWLDLISARITPQIHLHHIIVPFVGVEFKDIEELVLGSFKLLHPSVRHLETMGVNYRWVDVPKIIAGYRDRELWLYGCARGTSRVAKRRFRTQADLVAGLLAVAVAVMAKSGATRFFIGPNMSGHDSLGDATWFSWDESPKFTIHRSGIRGIPFEIDPGLRDQLYQASVIGTAMRIFETDDRTPLEETISRGFHWFADAHRDPTLVMQFVKYWSCIEAFFSTSDTNITKSLSVGVAAVLVFGGFEFVPRANYSNLKKRMSRLYALRSRAIHRASRGHITESDVSELSRYAAQLLINAVAFVEQGYREPDEIKRLSMRLDEQVERGRGSDSSN